MTDVIVDGTLVSKTWYDDFGNQDCTTKPSATKAACNGPKNSAAAGVLTDFTYDPLDRQIAQASYEGTGGSPTDSSEYIYDALDRTLQETEDHQGDQYDRTTDFSYLGLGTQVSEEKQSGGPAVDARTKSYSYNALGQRISMTDQSSDATKPEKKSFTFGNDVHGSTSQLLDENNKVEASYGYDAYGNRDTKDEDQPSLTSGDVEDRDPLNPFRFSGKRMDSGTAGEGETAKAMDMGARRYGPDLGQFLQEDMFQSSLGDLGLSTDPLSQNRYALAGGNPVSNIEIDGHMALADGGGGGTTSAARPRSPPASPPPVRTPPTTRSPTTTTAVSVGGSRTGPRTSATRSRARATGSRTTPPSWATEPLTSRVSSPCWVRWPTSATPLGTPLRATTPMRP